VDARSLSEQEQAQWPHGQHNEDELSSQLEKLKAMSVRDAQRVPNCPQQQKLRVVLH
jgi:hypothetical protein